MTRAQGCSFAGEYDILDLAYQIGSFGEKINGRKNISDSLRNNPLLDKRFTPG